MFTQTINKSSRQAMTDYLTQHFRYPTLSYVNRMTSYAHNVKINRLNLPNDLTDKAYDLFAMDETIDALNDEIEEWTEAHNHQWTAGFNGRSGGYLVLYASHLEPDPYLSFCTACGQKNFTKVEENSTRCGNCGQTTRRNYETPRFNLTTESRDIDDDKNFSDWSMEDLRTRVALVQDFDQLADDLREEFLYLLENFCVTTEEILVPQKIKVMKECALS